MGAFEKESAYSVKLGDVLLSQEDTQKVMEIFENYLNDESWHETLNDAIPIFDRNYGDCWWNPIVDNRAYYYFYITRSSDYAVTVVYVASSVYSEDKFVYQPEEFEALKSLIYKYAAPFREVKQGDIVACRNFGENAVTLTREEREVITKAYQYAWADGMSRYMSGADYGPYSGVYYTFRYSESDEYVFLYYYDGYANLYLRDNGGSWLHLSEDDTMAVEKIIEKYFAGP